MKVLHLSTFDLRGGAAQAAHRLHHGLLAEGVDSHMGVQFRDSDEWRVHGPLGKFAKAAALFRDTLDPLPRRLYRRANDAVWSLNWVPHRLDSLVEAVAPDIVHLHWVNAGFVPVRALRRLARPLVWTLHDMWPFTGGCHYAGGCRGFERDCGRCPHLGSRRRRDLSRRLLAAKKTAWADVSLQPVAPSDWLANEARASALFGKRDVRVIPNGLDLSVYRPRAAMLARDLLGLPQQPRLLLFVAAGGLRTPGKGADMLERVLAPALAGHPDAALLVLGSSQPEPGATGGPQLPVHYMGRLFDDVSRALVYAAADVMVSTSLQDNLPNTVVEALACGTPVAAFAAGGIREMVTHRQSGYLAEPGDIVGLGRGIAWLLEHPRPEELQNHARLQARAFDMGTAATAYRLLYAHILHPGAAHG